jgi:hypothetical protein
LKGNSKARSKLDPAQHGATYSAAAAVYASTSTYHYSNTKSSIQLSPSEAAAAVSKSTIATWLSIRSVSVWHVFKRINPVVFESSKRLTSLHSVASAKCLHHSILNFYWQYKYEWWWFELSTVRPQHATVSAAFCEFSNAASNGSKPTSTI